MTDEDVEARAREICKVLGLPPDTQIAHLYGDDMTPAERHEKIRHCIPVVMIYSPRWRLYRHAAAMALTAEATHDPE